MKRTLENVPEEIELLTEDGALICVVPLDPLVRVAILEVALKEHQSLEVAAERLILRALRRGIRADA